MLVSITTCAYKQCSFHILFVIHEESQMALQHKNHCIAICTSFMWIYKEEILCK